MMSPAPEIPDEGWVVEIMQAKQWTFDVGYRDWTLKDARRHCAAQRKEYPTNRFRVQLYKRKGAGG